MSCTKPITTKQQSVFWLVSQSRHMSAIFVGSCWWISLAAASADPVDTSVNQLVDNTRGLHTEQNKALLWQFVQTAQLG